MELVDKGYECFKPQRGKFTPQKYKLNNHICHVVSNPNGVNLHITAPAIMTPTTSFKPQRGKFTHPVKLTDSKHTQPVSNPNGVNLHSGSLF